MAVIRTSTQRMLLRLFLLCIAACAAVGIWAVLFSVWDDFIERVLATTLTVGAASLAALGSAIPWHLKRWHPIGPAGVITTALALIGLLVIIWVDLPWFWQFEWVPKLVAIACAVAMSTAGTAVLSLARLRRGFEWVRKVTVASAFLLTALFSIVLLADVPRTDDLVPRIMGALGILLTCGVIAVPVLHRVSATPAHELVRTAGLNVQLTCPRCVLAQSVPVGRARCARCNLGFHIEIEEEHCPKCGYSLYNLQSSACPECGTSLFGIAASNEPATDAN